MKSIKDKLCATQRGGAFVLGKIGILMLVLLTFASVSEQWGLTPVYAEENDEINEEESGDYVIEEAGDATLSDNEIVVTKKILHRHTGNREAGGGCYSIPVTEYYDEEVRCPGSLHYWGDDWGTSECTVCGASYSGNRGGEQCPHSTTVTKSRTVYEMGCNKTGMLVGYVTYRIAPLDWARTVEIDVSIENIGMRLDKKPYILDGCGYEEGHFLIEDNGSYVLGIAADSNSNTASAGYKAIINNIDRTGPVLKAYEVLPSDWTRGNVDVLFSEVKDIQSDGTEGCGLDDSTYSLDGGLTWTDLAAAKYTENGTYEVMLRDRLGNTGINEINIENIDRQGPNIASIQYDRAPNIKETELKVICDDYLPDGRMGCGMAEEAYSFDGGVTWKKDNSLIVDDNRIIDFRVRDILGNETANIIQIDNIDTTEPEVGHTMTPDDWTNGDVKVTFSAKDINGKGEDGAGLPISCFSYDGGKTWTNKAWVNVENNGKISVIVRDLNDNYANYCVDVGIIDRVPPVVNVSYEYVDDEIMLLASVSDDLSGINESSALWKGAGGKYVGNIARVNFTGKYSFAVSDRAGNQVESGLSVDSIPLPPAIDEEEEEDDPVPLIILPVMEEVPIEESIQPIPTCIRTEESESVEEEKEPKEEVVTAIPRLTRKKEIVKDKVVAENKENWWDGLSTVEKALFILLLIILLVLLLLLLFLWSRSVVVMCEKTHDEYTVLGVKLLKLKNGNYYLNLDDKMWNRAESTHFVFSCNSLFVLLRKGQDVYFNFPEERVRMSEIDRKIDIIV